MYAFARAWVGCITVLFAAASPLEAAQFVFDDGLEHVYSDTYAYRGILLLNGSSLIFSAEIVASPLTSGVDSASDPGITSTASTAVTLHFANILGGQAIFVADGTTLTSGITSQAGAGIDLAGSLVARTNNFRRIVGGSSSHGSTVIDPSIARVERNGGSGILMRTDSAAQLAFGEVVGGTGGGGGSTGINVTRGGDGITVSSGATLVIDGPFGPSVIGGTSSCVSAADTGDAHGIGGHALNVLDGAAASIRNGTFRGGSVANATAGAIRGEGTAVAGHGLRTDDGARVTLWGGDFSAGFANYDPGSQPRPPIIPDPSAVRIDILGSAGPTRVSILGGAFSGYATSIEVPYTDLAAIDAELSIYGGQFTSFNPIALRLAHPDVTTTIFGGDLTLDGLPASSPITATAGTLAGTFVDGQAFALTFQRLNDAPLLLPEPSALPPAGLLALTAFARSRRWTRVSGPPLQ